MTTRHDDELFLRVHRLVTAQLDGDASQAEREELDSLVRESAAARRLFCDYMSETAQLRWRAGDVSSELLQDLLTEGTQPAWDMRVPLAAGILATLAVAAVLVIGLLPAILQPDSVQRTTTQTPPADRVSLGVATLTRLAGVQWTDEGESHSELSRLVQGDRLSFDAGEVEIVFDIGVDVVIRGPAQFEVRAIDRAYSGLGKITARVGKTGEGFVLETPAAKVVDLGTEFSVEVTATGSTDVAVFRGLVDLSVTGPHRGGSVEPRTPQRLRQGEALRVGMNGSFGRLMTISSDRFPSRAGDAAKGTAAPVIVDVRDNGDGDVKKFYRIVRAGLQEDSLAFVDRSHQWNGVDEVGIPEFLTGIEYVMPYNDDKFVERLEVCVDLGVPAVLYVFLSDDVPAPAWLTKDFVDTSVDIGLDETRTQYKPKHSTEDGPGRSVDTVFSVWRREVPEATTVTLGPIQAQRGRDGFNMYGIAAAPLTTGSVNEASASPGVSE